MTRIITPIQKKRAQLEVLEVLLDKISDMEESNQKDYRVIGKTDEQATDWRTGELLWEDDEHTIPKMKDEWGSVDIPEEEMTVERLAKKDALTWARAILEKLV